MAKIDLRKLGPEPWGGRLARAREEAGYGLKDVATALPHWITKSTLNAFEHRSDPPTRSIDRARVVLALVLYGVDPAEFGLSITDDAPEDGPPLERIRSRGLAFASSRCIALSTLEKAAA